MSTGRSTHRPPGRRLLVPEVVQTSAMDCGPACLTALLAGFGLPASYGRLREACQTDVDGTSIDALEEVAGRLGLVAEQVLIPVDHLLIAEAEALPAILVTRLPGGLAHFVVVWRRQAGRVQLMDPAIGRRWVHPKSLLRQAFVHAQEVPAADWRAWAGTAGFLAPLAQRLRRLGAGAPALIEEALADPSWRGLARLDAATRLVTTLLESGAVRAGSAATALVSGLVRSSTEVIPAGYWVARPGSPADETAESLILRGAVLVRVAGVCAEGHGNDRPLSVELDRVRSEPRPKPLREIARLAALDGRGQLALFGLGALAAAVARTLEATVFRGLLDLVGDLGSVAARLHVVVMVALLLGVGVGLRYANESLALAIGARVELRLRLAFLRKLPRLGYGYLRTRPVSDLAERAHGLAGVTDLVATLRTTLQTAAQLLITGLAMALLLPSHAVASCAAAIAALLLPIAALPLLRELDLRQRTHLGALGRFQLDAAHGLIAARSHGAQGTLESEQAGFLAEYAGARLSLLRLSTAVEVVQAMVVLAGVAWLVWQSVLHDGAAGSVLLLAYWGLDLPVLGRILFHAIQGAIGQRNVVLRLLEPLQAPEENADADTLAAPGDPALGPAAVDCTGVTVVAGGRELLSAIDLRLEPGEQIAVVGPSGAGKSTLVGLLLGRHLPASGTLRVDQAPLLGAHLHALRAATVWVDPAVQLWNRSLLDNLRYGAPGDPTAWDRLLDECELRGLLGSLPDGLRTPLGEGGGLVSGGEGQRVRLGRAMARPTPRLVVLDEPFRGLARSQRQRLLERCRERWRGITMVCVTHDIEETLAFDRVAVVADGRLVEQGPPAELACHSGPFRSLLEADRRHRAELWGESRWRSLWVEDGRIRTAGRTP